MLKRLLISFILLCGLARPAAAQLGSAAYTFSPGTIIRSSEINSLFATIYANSLNRTGGTMTGSLTTLGLLPTTTNASDLGSSSLFYRSIYARTSVVLGQTTANYTLTWADPAAARAISIADPGGTDVFTFNAASQTLTNKSVSLGSNTVTGTTTQFNTALSDNDFATLAGTETLTGKSISLGSNTLTATSAQLITAVSDETGSGLLVFGTSPTLTTPVIASINSDLSVTGTIESADATTPILSTAAGKTNTGYLSLTGKTSGSLKLLPADAMAQIVTIAGAAQTVGAATLTIPDQAGVSSDFVFTTLAQTLTNKTLSFGSNTFSMTSAQLATAVSNEIGSGNVVFNNQPTFAGPQGGPGASASAYMIRMVDSTTTTVGWRLRQNSGFSLMFDSENSAVYTQRFEIEDGGAGIRFAATVNDGEFLIGSGNYFTTSTLRLPNAGVVGDIPYVSSTNIVSMLADVAAGSYLRSGGVTTAPVWSTLILPNAATANQVCYASATNTISCGSAGFTYDGTNLTLTGTGNAVGTITSGVWNAGAVTSSGVLTVNGFGAHVFSAGSTGENYLKVANTTDGAANNATLYINAGTTATEIYSLPQSYTTSTWLVQAGTAIRGSGAGGVSIAATNASGDIRLYAGGTTVTAKNEASTGDWYTNDGTVSSLSDGRSKDRVGAFFPGLVAIQQIVKDLGMWQHKPEIAPDLPHSLVPFVGVRAQVAQRYIPEAVTEGVDGFLRLKTGPIFWAGMRAITEVSDHVDAQEARITALEAALLKLHTP